MGSNPSKNEQITRSSPKSESTDQNVSKTETVVDGPLVVIAIDFGTVHSGFAYSFKGYENNVKSATHGGMLEEDRVPTVVLLNSDKTFHSFGYQAQINYCGLEEIERKSYFYLENFKMALYKKKVISHNMTIQDITGKPVKAMKVFSMAIENLKKISLKIVFQSILGLRESDLQWMITIPAISSDSARQFMREAARDAGIPENQLRLVLEPEAAALYSQKQTMLDLDLVCRQQTLLDDDRLPVGFKYVLADLGGGTSDFCVHEVLGGSKLREVYRATGEIAGGIDVDAEFVSCMKELVGEQVWAEFQSNYTSAYIDLMNNFQKQKQIFSSSNKATELKIENALLYVLEERKELSLPVKIKESKNAEKMEYFPIEARLNIHCDLMKLFFKPSIDKIVKLVNTILEECTGDINTLLLVGGYSESPYLRERIQSEFSNMRVVLVEDARLAVLNGAVLMGWKPRNIIQRRSRFTYGFVVRVPFIDGKHPESHKILHNGQFWCSLVFKKMIEKGQIVEYGQTFIHAGYCTARKPEQKRKERYTSLWRSTRKNPQYCIEQDECSVVGEIVKKPPPDGWPDCWDTETHLIVGETEFIVKNFNLTTGQEYEAQMNFL